MGLTKDYSFSSERLIFRGITAGDAPLIVEWRSKPENYRNFFNARPITLDEHMSWFAGYLENRARYDFMVFTSEGVPIGTVGLSGITTESCEVSYMIGAEEARGKGYASEALSALCDVAFQELGVKSVQARILPHNERSIRCASRVGFRETERIYELRRQERA